MRSKEQAHDYRYFPDPDLVPLTFTEADIAALRATLPPLPAARFDRYSAAGLAPLIATQLIDSPGLADYFDAVVAAGASVQSAANFILGDASRLANESGTPIGESQLTPNALAELSGLVEAKTINSKIAKELLARLWSQGGSPKAIVQQENLGQVADPATVVPLVQEVLAANAQSVTDYRAGKENALKYLMGQVMKDIKNNEGQPNGCPSAWSGSAQSQAE
jgi:aspartyl-tRNA(Asn)/glutamyl-tRNA(Gln) amidotransferase subunit B